MAKSIRGVSYRERLIKALESIRGEQVEAFVNVLVQAWMDRRLVLVVGNGGSAATASHMATDLGVGSQRVNSGIRVISCVDNVSVLTAVGNDTSFGSVFAEQIALLGEADDVLIAISASGNSPNVIEAVGIARERGMTIVALTGFSGGQLRKIADVSVHVDTEIGDYGPAEDAHLAINHMVTELLRARLTGTNTSGSIHG